MTQYTVYISIINLARATKRRATMEAEMGKVGLTAQFCEAVDLKDMTEGDLLRDCLRQGPWGVFLDKDMACTLSHAKAWEAFLTSDAEYGLIFEDDVHVSPDLKNWLADLSWWPEGADIVKLERWRSPRKKVLLDMPGHSHAGRSIARLLSRHSGGAGYIINRRAARRLLAAKPFPMCVDQLLFNPVASPVARDLSIYQVMPALVEQGNDPDEVLMPGDKSHRPKGAMLLRQKIVRGWYEIAYPPRSIFRYLTRRARLFRIPYVADCTTQSNSGTSPTHPLSNTPAPAHGSS